jgi:hypothetical protein
VWRGRRHAPSKKRFEEFTVATPTNKTAPQPAAVTEIPALAQKSREQMVSNLQQGRQLSVDVAQTWVKAVSALPVMDLPTIPVIPAMASLGAVTTYTFDLAADLLNAQRDFAQQLTNVLVPAKTS